MALDPLTGFRWMTTSGRASVSTCMMAICALAFLSVPKGALAQGIPSLTGEGEVIAGPIEETYTAIAGNIAIGSATDPVLDIGSYFAETSGEVRYGVLSARSSITFSNVDALGRNLIEATSDFEFIDFLTFDSPGLTGTGGFAEIAYALSGDTFAETNLGAGDFTFTSEARGFFELETGGSRLIISPVRTSAGSDLDATREGAFLVPIVFGEELRIRGRLQASALTRGTALDTGASGSALSSFENTGGVTGFRAFGADMTPVEFGVGAASGAFELYVVPEPGSALLLGLGLIGLGLRRTRTGSI